MNPPDALHGVPSYPTIYALGHPAVADLTSVPVYVEEKVDGSQFSFGLVDGRVQARSKGAVVDLNAPPKLFDRAAETVLMLEPHLRPGWIYRAEYLRVPKHNALTYNQVPPQYLILFDVSTGVHDYLDDDSKRLEANRLGLWCVPLLYQGLVELEQLLSLLERESVLGGPRIEGVVLKPVGYDLFGKDKRVVFGKFVSEQFKETHAKAWGGAERGAKPDIVTQLATELTTPARWQKAIQHLAEQGALEHSPRDIGALMQEIVADVERECAELVKARLWAAVWPQLRRRLTHGFPEFYKQQLLQRQFGGVTGTAGIDD